MLIVGFRKEESVNVYFRILFKKPNQELDRWVLKKPTSMNITFNPFIDDEIWKIIHYEYMKDLYYLHSYEFVSVKY